MVKSFFYDFLNEHDKNLKYQDSIMAFIDILGFRQLVNDEKNIPIIAGILSTLTGNANRENSMSRFRVKTAVISDTIILSSRQEGDTLQFFEIVSTLLKFLAINGLLSRGAISIGGLYHDDNIVFGPALVTAYQLEKIKAIYPRVVIDDKAMSLLPESVCPLITTDKNDVHYYDFLGCLQKQSDAISKLVLKNITTMCEEYLNADDMSDTHIREKYEWLKEELIRTEPHS